MTITKTIPVPHRRKPRTHHREPGVNLLDQRRIILEMNALLAAWPGITQLNRFKNIHASMRHDGRPVMRKNDHRQKIPQSYVYNNPGCERDKGFKTCFCKFAEPRGKPDT